MTPSSRQGEHEFVLHIGTMKSGTSYLQAILRRNKAALSNAGIYVPPDLVAAVSNVLGRRGVTKEHSTEGFWQEFLDTAALFRGPRVLASQEFMSGATAEEAQGLVATLPEGQVRVVITNRDLARVIPSHWQTVVKNGATVPFPEYVRLVMGEAPPDPPKRRRGEPRTEGRSDARYHRGFWRHHDIGLVIDNWASAVGAENITLVTVPQSGSAGSDELWVRFCASLDIDPADYTVDADAKSNVSLTFAETEMLRSVNEQTRGALGPLSHRLLVNKYLANKLLRQAPDPDHQPDRPRLGVESYEAVRRRADEMVAHVEASGVRVIGDLDDLRVRPYTGEPDAVDSPSPSDAIPASVPNAISQLILRINALEQQVAEAGGAAEGGDEAYERRFQRGKGNKKKRNRRGGKKGNRGAQREDVAEVADDEDEEQHEADEQSADFDAADDPRD